jgi:hypothetical protein
MKCTDIIWVILSCTEGWGKDVCLFEMIIWVILFCTEGWVSWRKNPKKENAHDQWRGVLEGVLLIHMAIVVSTAINANMMDGWCINLI